MKNKILAIAFISITIFMSCNKKGSMEALETAFVSENISSVDTKDNSFPVDIPLKEKNGKDFIIEEGGELKLKRIDIVQKKINLVATSTQNDPPIFQIKVDEKGNYVDIPNDGLSITRKSEDGKTYKFDVKLKSGILKKRESIDFSFSVKKTATSNVVEFKKQMTAQNGISVKRDEPILSDKNTSLSHATLLTNHVDKDVQTNLTIELKDSQTNPKEFILGTGGSVKITDIKVVEVDSVKFKIAKGETAGTSEFATSSPVTLDYGNSKSYSFNIIPVTKIEKDKKIKITFSIITKQGATAITITKEIKVEDGFSITSDPTASTGQKLSTTAAEITFTFKKGSTDITSGIVESMILTKAVTDETTSKTIKAATGSSTTPAAIPSDGLSLTAETDTSLAYKLKVQTDSDFNSTSNHAVYTFKVKLKDFPVFNMEHKIKGKT